MGWDYWSLSSYVKRSVKNAVSFIGAFEDAIARYALRENVQGVICGHIHHPAARQIGGIQYYNTGDWVESLSALVEHPSGKLELLTHLQVQAPVKEISRPRIAQVA
jgi:UDP-2,3-diacylglucosamine pyrophosphatase LpxH